MDESDVIVELTVSLCFLQMRFLSDTILWKYTIFFFFLFSQDLALFLLLSILLRNRCPNFVPYGGGGGIGWRVFVNLVDYYLFIYYLLLFTIIYLPCFYCKYLVCCNHDSDRLLYFGGPLDFLPKLVKSI